MEEMIIGVKEVILISYKNMLNYSIYYLMLGLLTNFIIDILSDHFDSPIRLTTLEKIFVGLLWPWSLFKLITEFIKAKK
jgi:hypothetical protein